MIERDGLSIFALGTAAELKLSGGLSDPAVLERAAADLRAIPAFAGDHDLEPAMGDDGPPVPIALGALAFDRRSDRRARGPRADRRLVQGTPGARHCGRTRCANARRSSP